MLIFGLFMHAIPKRYKIRTRTRRQSLQQSCQYPLTCFLGFLYRYQGKNKSSLEENYNWEQICTGISMKNMGLGSCNLWKVPSAGTTPLTSIIHSPVYGRNFLEWCKHLGKTYSVLTGSPSRASTANRGKAGLTIAGCCGLCPVSQGYWLLLGNVL